MYSINAPSAELKAKLNEVYMKDDDNFEVLVCESSQMNALYHMVNSKTLAFK